MRCGWCRSSAPCTSRSTTGWCGCSVPTSRRSATGRGSPNASPAAKRLIVETAIEAGKRGVSSVLDLGFQRADQRQRIAQQAQAAGLAVRLHFIDVPAEERWRRVSGRNDAQGETYRVTVTRPMFDFIESIWQPPSPDEMAALDGVRLA